MPKVTVCIPTYNRAHLLPYAVNSVLQQTYPDFELLICDDGSPDNTAEVVAQWDDERIRYIRHPQNIGRSDNMRSGFDAAKGDYFIKFDDDDALDPEFLAKTVAVLDAEPQVDFVCTDHWVINQKNERLLAATKANSAFWKKDKLQEGIIPDLVRQTFDYQSLQMGSTLFRRQCLAEIDYMRPEADGSEDFDLLVRLALAGKTGYFLPEFLMEYRLHETQKSFKYDVHFLSAKVFCIDSYSFADKHLEKLRIEKLAWTQQALGLRLIEKGEAEKGRKILHQATQVLGSNYKAKFGILLSYFPLNLRQFAYQTFRKIRPQEYSEKVRQAFK